MTNSEYSTSLIESEMRPRDIESSTPEPHFMTVAPYVPNNEFKKVQQRILEQEERLFQH